MTNQVTPIGTKCPECGKGQFVPQTRTEEFDFDLGEETVTVRAENVPVLQCDQCGEVMSGPAAAKVRHEAVCRAAGFLTPSEYKSIREELEWSQQRLADLTGFGVATVSRSECGRLLPNRSYNIVLLAIRDCSPFREYLERLHELQGGKREANPASGNGSTPATANQDEPKPTSDNGPARSSKVSGQANPGTAS
jgi:putative zinc finger/helix-turn-helix YgiT family protein